MEEKQEKMFKTPNDLKVVVTKSNGEVVIDEECCTMVSIILKNSGDIAASFFGAHNPEVVKVLEKSLKGYFKGIKKELKKNYLAEDEDEIKVVTDNIPEENKWSGEQVPDLEKGVEPSKVPATKVSPVTKKDKSEITDEKKSTSKKEPMSIKKDKVKKTGKKETKKKIN
jgi:hypothetical protein